MKESHFKTATAAKKLLSLVLMLFMVLGLFPASASAYPSESAVATVYIGATDEEGSAATDVPADLDDYSLLYPPSEDPLDDAADKNAPETAIANDAAEVSEALNDKSDSLAALSLFSVPDKLVVATVYGGAIDEKGSTATGVPVSHSFVEIYNPNSFPVALDGYSLFYQGYPTQNIDLRNGWARLDLDPAVTLPAKTSYLINCGATADGSTLVLSEFDQVWTDAPGFVTKGAKYVITYGVTSIDSSIVNPFNTDGTGTKIDGYIDMFGGAGNDSGKTDGQDGYETSPLDGSSKQKGFGRYDRDVDTDNNRNDFQVIDYRSAAGPRSMSAGPLYNVADKTALETAITAADDKTEADYTTDSWATFAAALASARTVFASDAATADEVSDALSALNAAINGLTEAGAGSYSPLTYADLLISVGSDESELMFTWYTAQITGQLAIRAQGEANFVAIATTDAQSGDSYIHRATVAGLAPATTYEYRLIGEENAASDIFTVKTGGADSFRFIAVGDPQIGSSNVTNDTNGWINTLNRVTDAFPDASFLLSAGDQVETPNVADHYTGYLKPDALKSLPTSNAVGNHDSGSALFTDHFQMPNATQVGSGATNYDWWYTYNDTLFMFIDANYRSTTAGHRAMMEAAIAANPDVAWKVVVFHQGPYTNASHDNNDNYGFRTTWTPMFDDLGIDVVLNGHDHSYTRAFHMRGDVAQKDQQWLDDDGNIVSDDTGLLYSKVFNPTATAYFELNSASGSKFYALKAPKYFVAKQVQTNTANFSIVDVTDESFTVTTYALDGRYDGSNHEVIDTYTIFKSDAPPPVDKTALETAITAADDKAEADYTTDSWATFAAALASARTVFASDAATADEVSDALNALNAAIAGLTEAAAGDETFSLSAHGDSYYFYGRKNAEFLTDAFDMTALADWTLGNTTVGFGGSSGGNSITTTIPTGSGPNQRGALHTWTYFKKTFTLPDDYAANAYNIIDVAGEHIIDDALVIYINGTEVYTYNSSTANNGAGDVAIGGPYSWNEYPGSNTEDWKRTFDINSDYTNLSMGAGSAHQSGSPDVRHAASSTNLRTALRPGENVITCVVGQRDSGSSDLFFSLNLDVTLEKADAPVVDKTALETAIASASDKVESEYTAESWTVFADAFTAAQQAADDVAATQEEIDAAATILTAATDALVLLPPAPGKVIAGVRVNAVSDINAPVEFIVSLRGAQDAEVVALEFEADGNKLGDNTVEALNGFEAMGPIAWTALGGGLWQGKVTLVLYGNAGEDQTSGGTVDIAKFSYQAKELGDAVMKLITIEVAGTNEYPSGNISYRIDSEIETGEGKTSIEEIIVYSRYDLNKDGKVDILDLAIALSYCQYEQGDSEWEQAEKCDVNEVNGGIIGDGEINMLDLLAIFLNYTN
jgi:hypothetical protein